MHIELEEVVDLINKYPLYKDCINTIKNYNYKYENDIVKDFKRNNFNDVIAVCLGQFDAQYWEKDSYGEYFTTVIEAANTAIAFGLGIIMLDNFMDKFLRKGTEVGYGFTFPGKYLSPWNWSGIRFSLYNDSAGDYNDYEIQLQTVSASPYAIFTDANYFLNLVYYFDCCDEFTDKVANISCKFSELSKIIKDKLDIV